MLKGFHICPGLVDDVPLNIIRCQQLADQKPMLLQQRFRGMVSAFRFIYLHSQLSSEWRPQDPDFRF